MNENYLNFKRKKKSVKKWQMMGTEIIEVKKLNKKNVNEKKNAWNNTQSAKSLITGNI